MTDAILTPAPPPLWKSLLLDGLKLIASLKLTVVLLALSIVLVFAGTLAQIDLGIEVVLHKYFRSFLVWIPLQVFFPRSWGIPGAVPYPGGWLLGGVLLMNLLAAHAVRFKFTRRRIGILLTHAGLMILLASEVVTGTFAVEGHMTIEVGGASNYVEDLREIEFAVIQPSAGPGEEEVTVVPGSRFRKGGRIRHGLLPFEISVDRFMVNARLASAGGPHAGRQNLATAGEGLKTVAVEQPPVSGADPEQRMDLPTAYVTVYSPESGSAAGTYLVSLALDPQTVQVGGRKFEISLRLRRMYKPYTIHLAEFRHDKYVGTEVPKNFSSRVVLKDPERTVDREFLISMNSPLRYAGETFYQASFLKEDRGTVLQVVRNPGWLLPYISCSIVSLGLIIQFIMSLARFARRREDA